MIERLANERANLDVDITDFVSHKLTFVRTHRLRPLERRLQSIKLQPPPLLPMHQPSTVQPLAWRAVSIELEELN